MKTWLDSLAEHANPNIIKVLTGTKIDLADERRVEFEEALTQAKCNGMNYFETSALLNKGINELL